MRTTAQRMAFVDRWLARVNLRRYKHLDPKAEAWLDEHITKSPEHFDTIACPLWVWQAVEKHLTDNERYIGRRPDGRSNITYNGVKLEAW